MRRELWDGYEDLRLAAAARTLLARRTVPPEFEEFNGVIVMTFDSLFSRDVQDEPANKKGRTQ
jgi:hypothetical protein